MEITLRGGSTPLSGTKELRMVELNKSDIDAIDKHESDWRIAIPNIQEHRNDLIAWHEAVLASSPKEFYNDNRLNIERKVLNELLEMNPDDIRKMWTDYYRGNYPDNDFIKIEAKVHLFKVIVEKSGRPW